MKKIPELLAPAGTLDAFKTAVLYGADAIYAGLPGFSMRARAKIDVDGVKQGIEFAHAHGKKVYLAFNLFAHDRDFDNMPRVREVIEYLRPDALIVADAGVMMWVRENFPDMPIHVSTQANICSAASVKFWQNAGASLCVLAREVSHNEFVSIRKQCPDIKLEIFVHGAMCMSYSGRCLLSNFITGRPSNRGACAQLCRWKYDVILREHESGIEMPIDEDDRGAYIMNSKDLCLMPRLAEVLESEPDSLKIEGRNRSEYYVGSVVRAYRAAIDAWARDPEHFNFEPFMNDLSVLESRGYTTAFFDGPLPATAHDYETTRSSSEYHAAGVVTDKNEDSIIFELRNEIKAGDTITFILPHGPKYDVVLHEIINAKNGEKLSKMSAGQGNSVIIPRAWCDEHFDELCQYVLAYKHK
ncbi:MAG: U32 family peptidase C-terminal domain-containing protein [Alphaproteobacteria bacterium]|nr:U32 family peptidase C-terminal domain-containing protein [Alphaproteobacteria bacterium]